MTHFHFITCLFQAANTLRLRSLIFRPLNSPSFPFYPLSLFRLSPYPEPNNNRLHDQRTCKLKIFMSQRIF
jgi:hypothetical protein